MVVFLCIIGVPSSSTFAASNLEEGISELAQQISKNMTETGKKKIAVVEFSDLDGMVTAFGQHLAEELITELFLISPGQFEVVERRQLMKVLNEQKLTTSGLLDAKAMESVGKILGIEAIVTGSMTDLESNIKINARMIGIETAMVFAVARTSIPKIGIVAKLMAKEANITQPNLQTALKTTAKLSASSVYTNKNSKIYHKYNCPELNTEGLVEFESAKRAIKAGGMACRRCNPIKKTSTTSQIPIQEASLGSKSQEFKDLKVEVTELQLMKNYNIVVFLRYINKTQRKLHFVLVSAKHDSTLSRAPTFLTDESGNEYRLEEASGIQTVYDNAPLELIPGVPSTASLRFRLRERIPHPGSLFSFTSAQTILAADDYGNLYSASDRMRMESMGEWTGESSFNISIRDIEPKKK